MSEYEDKIHRSVTKANRAEDRLTREAVELKMNEPKLSEQAGRDIPSERPAPVTNAVVEELQTLRGELSQLQQQLAQQLTTAAVQDNTLLMVETKGMLRMSAMIAQNVEKRIETLFPTVGIKQ